MINAKTAHALDIIVPHTLLHANEVIDQASLIVHELERPRLKAFAANLVFAIGGSHDWRRAIESVLWQKSNR